jgi:hypothetical protein
MFCRRTSGKVSQTWNKLRETDNRVISYQDFFLKKRTEAYIYLTDDEVCTLIYDRMAYSSMCKGIRVDSEMIKQMPPK